MRTFTSLYNYGTQWILDRATQDYSWVQVKANGYTYDLAFANDIVLMSSNYREIYGPVEAVSHYAAADGMRINALQAKVI